MSFFTGTLGMGVTRNPLTDSPYVQQSDIGSGMPPPAIDGILTEGGTFILTEGGTYLESE